MVCVDARACQIQVRDVNALPITQTKTNYPILTVDEQCSAAVYEVTVTSKNKNVLKNQYSYNEYNNYTFMNYVLSYDGHTLNPETGATVTHYGPTSSPDPSYQLLGSWTGREDLIEGNYQDEIDVVISSAI